LITALKHQKTNNITKVENQKAEKIKKISRKIEQKISESYEPDFLKLNFLGN